MEAHRVKDLFVAKDPELGSSLDGSPSKEQRVSFLQYQVVLSKTRYGLGIYFAPTAEGQAMVDTKIPFYRLPGNQKGAGEASGIIQPGDLLVAIDEMQLGALEFEQIVEALRQIPCGPVRLTLERVSPSPSPSPSPNEKEEEEEEEEEAIDDNETRTTLHPDATLEPQEPVEPPTRSMVRQPSLQWQQQQRQHQQVLEQEYTAMVSTLEQQLVQCQKELSTERKCRLLAEKKSILYRQEVVRLSDENLLLRYQLRRLEENRNTNDKLLQLAQLSI